MYTDSLCEAKTIKVYGVIFLTTICCNAFKSDTSLPVIGTIARNEETTLHGIDACNVKRSLMRRRSMECYVYTRRSGCNGVASSRASRCMQPCLMLHATTLHSVTPPRGILMLHSSCCPSRQRWGWPWLCSSVISPHFSITAFSINSLQLLQSFVVVLHFLPIFLDLS